MNVLAQWWQAATPDEKKRLAALAETTVESLRQMAGAYRTDGELRVTTDLARRIERGTKALQRPGLKMLWREDLCPACAKCEFAVKCRKEGRK